MPGAAGPRETAYSTACAGILVGEGKFRPPTDSCESFRSIFQKLGSEKRVRERPPLVPNLLKIGQPGLRGLRKRHPFFPYFPSLFLYSASTLNIDWYDGGRRTSCHGDVCITAKGNKGEVEGRKGRGRREGRMGCISTSLSTPHISNPR